VLVPLSEIAPEQLHPVQQQTIRAMVEALPPGSDLVPILATW
jgi:7,8-dihydro-6-hydroxymethylpterin-pyrophosphokinase